MVSELKLRIQALEDENYELKEKCSKENNLKMVEGIPVERIKGNTGDEILKLQVRIVNKIKKLLEFERNLHGKPNFDAIIVAKEINFAAIETTFVARVTTCIPQRKVLYFRGTSFQRCSFQIQKLP